MNSDRPIRYMLRRPFESVLLGCTCVFLVELLRNLHAFDGGRIILALASGAGQLVALVALGEFGYQMVHGEQRPGLVRMLMLSVVVLVMTVIVIVRTGAGMTIQIYVKDSLSQIPGFWPFG